MGAFITLNWKAWVEYMNPFSNLPLLHSTYTFVFVNKFLVCKGFLFHNHPRTTFRFSLKSPPSWASHEYSILKLHNVI